MSITADEARGAVTRAVRSIVPDADVENLPPEANLSRTFELDSLDFLSFIALLVTDSDAHQRGRLPRAHDHGGVHRPAGPAEHLSRP